MRPVTKRAQPKGVVVLEFLGWVIIPVMLLMIGLQVMGIWVQRTRCMYQAYNAALERKLVIDTMKLGARGSVSLGDQAAGDYAEAPLLSYNRLGGARMAQLLRVECVIPTPNELGPDGQGAADLSRTYWMGSPMRPDPIP